MAAIWITGVSRPIPAIGCEADRAEEGLMQRRPMRRTNARPNGPPTAVGARWISGDIGIYRDKEKK